MPPQLPLLPAPGPLCRWLNQPEHATFDLVVAYYGRRQNFTCTLCAAVFRVGSGPMWRLAHLATQLPEWQGLSEGRRAIMVADDDLTFAGGTCLINRAFEIFHVSQLSCCIAAQLLPDQGEPPRPSPTHCCCPGVQAYRLLIAQPSLCDTYWWVGCCLLCCARAVLCCAVLPVEQLLPWAGLGPWGRCFGRGITHTDCTLECRVYSQWKLLYQQPEHVLRFTSFIEIMVRCTCCSLAATIARLSMRPATCSACC